MWLNLLVSSGLDVRPASLIAGLLKRCLFIRTARLQASRKGEGGAGGGRRPPPAPPSPCERRRREESERVGTFEKALNLIAAFLANCSGSLVQWRKHRTTSEYVPH